MRSGAADLDELQTLVDLSNKYFPESVHNATLREKLDTGAQEKARCQASPGSDLKHVKTIGEEAKSESKGCGSKNHLICASNSNARRPAWRCWQWTLMSSRKSCKCCKRRAMLTGAETTMCGERVFNLMLESLPKQLDQRPDFAATLDDVRYKHGEALSHGERDIKNGCSRHQFRSRFQLSRDGRCRR